MLALPHRPVLHLLLWALAAGGAAAGAPAYEEPPVLSADLLLPRSVLQGPHHRVREVVPNDGFLNTYQLESDFGLFTAVGDDLLRVRVREVGALAALDEVTRSEAFARAAAAAVTRPLETAATVVTQPGGTLKRLPSGVHRHFKRTARKIRKLAAKVDDYLDQRQEPEDAEPSPDAAEPGSDKSRELAASAARRYLGVGRSMRDWARRLGVDPYTTNEVLRRELERVAAVGSVGRLGVRLATPSLGLVGDLGEVNDLVWSYGAADLEILNVGRLKEMGLVRGEIETLLDNPAWSPSRLTGLVTALHGLYVVPDRGALARLALAAGSEEEAFFFERSVEILRLYHREVAPIRRIVAGEAWGGGVTAAGTAVLPLAVDHLAWTEDAATALGDAGARLLDLPGVERCELWLAGSASPRAREELARLRCEVEERLRARWLD